DPTLAHFGDYLLAGPQGRGDRAELGAGELVVKHDVGIADQRAARAHLRNVEYLLRRVDTDREDVPGPPRDRVLPAADRSVGRRHRAHAADPQRLVQPPA